MKDLERRLGRRIQELESGSAASHMATSGATGAGQGTLYAKLEASECYLLTAYAKSTQEPSPTCSTEGGILELSPFLYWLHHPSSEFRSVTALVVKTLELFEGGPLPPTKITQTLWASILHQAETEGIVGSDGTIFGVTKYEQLDPGWIVSLAAFLLHQSTPDGIHPFGDTPQVVPLGTGTGTVRVGVLGDWGTGAYGANGGPAPAVMSDMLTLPDAPDTLVHLGDVYYAGLQDEEQSNFLDLWPKGYGAGRAYTLNSNHEMYAGGMGYFDVALAAGGPFARQSGTSYFALEIGEWLVLGLDSAYFASPADLYMVGSIGTAEDPQAAWIRESFASRKGEKVIVMTHHNPMDGPGTSIVGDDPATQLWGVVCDALGGAPSHWYFGHTHNGVAYSDSSVMGQAGTQARLCGHGAIPFGKAWGLETSAGNGTIEYFAQTPRPGSATQVQNGFATLEFDSSGGLTESFYELSATPGEPAKPWTHSTPAEG